MSRAVENIAIGVLIGCLCALAIWLYGQYRIIARDAINPRTIYTQLANP